MVDKQSFDMLLGPLEVGHGDDDAWDILRHFPQDGHGKPKALLNAVKCC